MPRQQQASSSARGAPHGPIVVTRPATAGIHGTKIPTQTPANETQRDWPALRPHPPQIKTPAGQGQEVLDGCSMGARGGV